MTTNRDDLVYTETVRYTTPTAFGESKKIKYYNGGLSKREYFASMMLQGILSNAFQIQQIRTGHKGEEPTVKLGDTVTCYLHAGNAIAMADALIEKLNQ